MDQLDIKKINFNQDWKIYETLGKGGYGEVVRGKYIGQLVQPKYLDIKVLECAIKIIKNTNINNMNYEIRILKKLQYKQPEKNSTIQLYGYAKDLEYTYIFMGIIDGVPLYDIIKSLSTFEKKKIICNLLNTIIFIHQNKISHGDIKIENIMVNQHSFKIYLVDFGLGFCFDSDDSEYFQECGSKGYKSNEKIKGRKLGRKEDIYGFGVTCLLLINGYDTPFKIINRENENIGEMVFEIPESLSDVDFKEFVSACMVKKSINRPSAIKLKEYKYIKSIQNENLDYEIPEANKGLFIKDVFVKLIKMLKQIQFSSYLKSPITIILILLVVNFRWIFIIFPILMVLFYNFKQLRIGVSFGSRVLIDRTLHSSNRIEFYQKYIELDDIMILITKPQYNELHNKIQVVLDKDIELNCKSDDVPIEYRVLVLPKGIHISILPLGENNRGRFQVCSSISLSNGRIINYEGEIGEDSFTRNIALRYYCFSKHGFHYVKSQYVTERSHQNTSSIEMFLMLSGIIKSYLLNNDQTPLSSGYFKNNIQLINNDTQ